MCCALLALACQRATRPPAQSPRYPHSGDYAQEIAFEDQSRAYVLHLPPDYAKHVPLPLVIAFHSIGGNGPMFKRRVELDAQADALGWAVLYPDGTGPVDPRFYGWNAGTCCGTAKESGVDDVGFVLALLADLARDLDLDRTRVYAVGHSNGGMMAYRLAGAASDRIAAAVSVAGPDMTAAGPSGRPVPVLHIHSVDDPRASWEGGESKVLPVVNKHQVFRSVDDTLARWRSHDGCTGDGKVVEERSDGAQRAELVEFGPCADGSDVQLWRLHGVGHGWPGTRSMFDGELWGPSTKVIRASDEVYRFLQRFSRPDAPPLR
jgi:polyhydroxybutyrate depolymerase